MKVVGLHWIRNRQRALARGVLALFCVVWLQAALLPCAMAVMPDGLAGPQEEHCAYCPPADPSGAHHDAGAKSTCAYPDHPQVDTRGVSAMQPLLLAVPVVAYTLEPLAESSRPLTEPSRPPAAVGTPLAVTYCRFLF